MRCNEEYLTSTQEEYSPTDHTPPEQGNLPSEQCQNTGAVHLFGGCSIPRHPPTPRHAPNPLRELSRRASTGRPSGGRLAGPRRRVVVLRPRADPGPEAVAEPARQVPQATEVFRLRDLSYMPGGRSERPSDDSGECGVRRPCPGCGAACSVGPDLAFTPPLLQDEPDCLVADAWHCRPDVGETEGGGCMAQDVLADALLDRKS